MVQQLQVSVYLGDSNKPESGKLNDDSVCFSIMKERILVEQSKCVDGSLELIKIKSDLRCVLSVAASYLEVCKPSAI